MKWENNFTQSLQIKYPVVQAPMLGVTTPQMVAAISGKGGLGSLPVGGLPPETVTSLIGQTKRLTKGAFAVNLFANAPPPQQDDLVLGTMQNLLGKICIENGYSTERVDVAAHKFISYTEQIECLLRERIAVVSFTFGTLDSYAVREFKEHGTLLIGTATCLEEAQILCDNGIDIITAQGIEAGGHRGTFIDNIQLPQIPCMTLVAELSAKLNIPILAAGGISDGMAIKTAFHAGACGVQVGSAFIACDESAAIPAYKLTMVNPHDTVLTRAISGRWARGIKNKLIEEIEASGTAIPDFPLQGLLTQSIRMQAQQKNDASFTSLWAGLSEFNPAQMPAADILNMLIRQTENIW